MGSDGSPDDQTAWWGTVALMSASDAPSSAAGEREQLALLIDHVSDYAMFLLDPEGHILTWNRGAERIKGWRASEIIGRHFETFYLQEDRDRKHPQHELEIARKEGKYEEEGWRVRKDGTTFWANVLITCLRGDDGEVLGFGKVTRDLTARRLAEEQMRATAERLQAANRELEQFRRLVLSVRDYAIFMLDPGGHIATWNAGAEHIKGYSAEEVIGRHFSLFYTQDDRDAGHPARELEIAARNGRYDEEGWRVRKDGTTFWAGVLLTAVRDEHGILSGYAKITRDLTERRESEDALRAAHAELERTNRELDRFASVAAHDLREPLRTIGGFSDLLATRYQELLDDRGRGYLEHIALAVDRMERMVESLLLYARSGATATAGGRTALRGAIDGVVADLHRSIADRRAQVSIDVAEDAIVAAPLEDVALVVRNLVSNAVKFADAEAPQVDIAAEMTSDGWRLSVSDNGIGIDAADRPRVFGAFQRLHSASEYPGTGLGLAIAQRMVERHGGTIGVESIAGEGSRFWFLLPAPAD
jgi:PAS domain S-box-containing protein